MTFTVSGTSGLTFPDASTQAKSAANGQTGSAPFYSARAWVNFNGTGTVAIRASGNVSSITDNGTGNYTVNFTVALSDANYSYQLSDRYAASTSLVSPRAATGAPTASALSLYTMSYSNTNVDCDDVCVAVFR